MARGRNSQNNQQNQGHVNNNNRNMASRGGTFGFVQTTVTNNSGQVNNNLSKLVKQQIDFAIQDAEDYKNDYDIYNIAPSRRQEFVEKLDAIIKKFDDICAKYVITKDQREQIREWRYELELKANNICCIDDEYKSGIIETDDEEDEYDDDSYYVYKY